MDLLPLGQLAGDWSAIGRQRARIESNAFGPASVRIHRAPHPRGQEAYRMDVTPKGIEIAAGGDAGGYYAVQTLREMLAVYGRQTPACSISDWPDLPRRAVYHDCSRGKVPQLQTLKGLAERLARWKINELQLYVEDIFAFRRHPAIGRGCSPFRPEELLALQDHCKKHHVRMVGSLASFGHMERIVSLPEYRHLGEGSSDPLFPYGATLCPVDPRSIKFMEELYEEFVPLFEAADFNICCDETWEIGKKRSRRAVQKLGAARVYLDFFRKLCARIRRHGKRPNAWADIVLNHPEVIPDLPKDVVMLNWDYSPEAKRAARTKELTGAGLAAMVCPWTSAGGTHGQRLDRSMTNIRRCAALAIRDGAEGLLNTDWGDDGHRNFLGASLHGFAYGGACAWNGRAVDDRSFPARFCFHLLGDRRGKLTEALDVIGRRKPHAGQPNEQGILYYTLVERVRWPAAEYRYPWGWWWQDWAAKISRPALQNVIARLSPLAENLEKPNGLEDFDRLALAEWQMGARMDVLAARRALAVKGIREGRVKRPAELKALASDMRRMAEDFKTLWLARNKPSQLRDNMRHFARAAAELC